MKNINLFIVTILGILMTSCSTYTYTSRSTKVNRADLNATAMVVDIRPDFSQRIVTESRGCTTPEMAKEEAKYQAVVENKCDVVVDPIYKIEKRGNNNYIAFLTGFAGFYENPRTIYEDIALLKNVRKEDIEKYLIIENPNILGLMNPTSPSEVINIYDGQAPQASKPAQSPAPQVTVAPTSAATVSTPTPAPAATSSKSSSSSKKRK